MNYFSGLFSIFLPSRFGGPCGMDVMRWSTEKAIYPPFVLLRSFKKANSLKANREREKEREREREGEGERERCCFSTIDSPQPRKTWTSRYYGFQGLKFFLKIFLKIFKKNF